MVAGLALTGAYYLLAGLVFPDRPAEWPDLDEWYMSHRRVVIGGIGAINVLVVGGLSWAEPMRLQPVQIAVQLTYFTLVAAVLWSADRRVNGVALAALIALYVGLAGLTFAAA